MIFNKSPRSRRHRGCSSPSRRPSRNGPIPYVGPVACAETCCASRYPEERRDRRDDLRWLRSPRNRPRRAPLTSSHGATDRPFTVIVCTDCAPEQDLSVVDELRPTIRRCSRAMLVAAACMLGPLTCASRPTGCGVMAVLQPCTTDRVACGPPQWIGPITDDGDTAVLRDWLELGQWETTPLPKQLSRHLWARSGSHSN